MVSLEGAEQRLEPLPFAVLGSLVAAFPDTVRREELLDLWPNPAASDESLTQAISTLRKALGDEARPADIIRTVPKTGYRLGQPPVAESQTAPNHADTGKGRVTPAWRTFLLAAGLVSLAGAIGYAAWLNDRASRRPQLILEIGEGRPEVPAEVPDRR